MDREQWSGRGNLSWSCVSSSDRHLQRERGMVVNMPVSTRLFSRRVRAQCSARGDLLASVSSMRAASERKETGDERTVLV